MHYCFIDLNITQNIKGLTPVCSAKMIYKQKCLYFIALFILKECILCAIEAMKI